MEFCRVSIGWLGTTEQDPLVRTGREDYLQLESRQGNDDADLVKEEEITLLCLLSEP